VAPNGITRRCTKPSSLEALYVTSPCYRILIPCSENQKLRLHMRTTVTCSSVFITIITAHRLLMKVFCLARGSHSQTATNIDHNRNQNPPNSHSVVTEQQATTIQLYIFSFKCCCSHSILRKERGQVKWSASVRPAMAVYQPAGLFWRTHNAIVQYCRIPIILLACRSI
jgi:hypothetical protein